MSDGHVYPQADKYNWGTSWEERPMLFHNIEGKKFEAVPAVEGSGLAVSLPAAAWPWATCSTTASSTR
jgi:hypothetical protein